MSTGEFKPEDRKNTMEELGRALRVFLSASDAFDEVLGKVLGLNPTDVRCVDLLDQHGTLTAGALAELAGLSTGAVTFLLDRLERAGFVRRLRDVQDRRRVLVELDPLAEEGIRAPRPARRGLAGIRAALFVVRARARHRVPQGRGGAVRSTRPAARVSSCFRGLVARRGWQSCHQGGCEGAGEGGGHGQAREDRP